MKIGLIDVDGHAKKKKRGATVYPNLALCKIASYHRSIGDDVDWYDNMYGGEYDKVYVAKVFNFSPDIDFIIRSKEIVRGGTGYDIKSKLPQYIDDCQPDYSIYPFIDKKYSFGFLTRGCPNKCAWCVVPKKEGYVSPYWDIDRVANGKKEIILMDNNILAAGEYAINQLNKIVERGYKIDFNQAMDARLINDENAKILSSIKWINNRIRFGCDTTNQIKDCEKAISKLIEAGFKGSFFLYTMIGGKNDFLECYNRINYWHEKLMEYRRTKKGAAVYAYAQPYRDPLNINKCIPLWQKDMAYWCNKRMIFTSTSFADFEPRKGFKCQYYIDKYINSNDGNSN